MIVQCLYCGEEMALGSLTVHLQIQHGKLTGGIRKWGTTAPGGEPRTYKMDFPNSGRVRNLPVKGCRGRAVTRTAMQVHSLHQHFQDTMIILEEGNLTHPR